MSINANLMRKGCYNVPFSAFYDLLLPEICIISAYFCTMREKQKRFCQEYLIDSDATKAAIRAGYAKRSAASIGCDLLKHPEVKQHLDELRAELKERTMVKAEEVVAELWRVGKARIDQVISWENGQVNINDSSSLPEDVKSAIQCVRRVDTESGSRIEVNMHDKVMALDKLCRALGLYQDKVDVTSGGNEMPAPIIMLAQQTNVNG